VWGTKGTFPLAQNFQFAFSGIFPVLGLRGQPREQPSFTQNFRKFLSCNVPFDLPTVISEGLKCGN